MKEATRSDGLDAVGWVELRRALTRVSAVCAKPIGGG
jgi:hypothetical protein